jgi:transketolase
MKTLTASADAIAELRKQAAATVVDLFRRDHCVAIVMADISLDLLRPAAEHDPRREAVVPGTPRETSEVVVVEPFYEGTLAAQVSAALAHRPTRLLSIGVPRRAISRYGTPEEHDRALGLDIRGIRDRVLAFV